MLVVALGGNALSPPGRSADDYADERHIVDSTSGVLNRLADQGFRLLVVHGNGPQVGRLLSQDPAHGSLDIHIAQTQGELGYLLAAGFQEPAACLLSRVEVADDVGPPVKAIGPILEARPQGPAARAGDGWRRIVASPRPLRVIEADAVEALLGARHVIAGGGGGVALDRHGRPVDGVVDKDRVAALLAIRLDARHLVIATDVPGVYGKSGQRSGEPLSDLSPARARDLVRDGIAAPGSMGPKLESAIEFFESTGRWAGVCALDGIEATLRGDAGTRIG
jgi:carbamate kinase